MSHPEQLGHAEAEFGRVAVIYGGTSAEREVSLASGQAVFQALQASGIHAELLDLTPQRVKTLLDTPFDRAFIALHGAIGEDGVLQGLLELLQIPYTGSGVGASALGMDKQRAKWIWQALKLPTPEFSVVQQVEQACEAATDLGFPVILKPTSQGSTIGVYKAADLDQVRAVYPKVACHGSVLVERWIEGTEYTVAIVNERAFPSILIEPAHDLYDYQAKYQSTETQYHCPSPLSGEEEAQLQQLALTAYQALGAQGWGRVDFRRDRWGNFWILEVNTVPGLTPQSLVPKAAQAAGLSFSELVIEILKGTLKR